MDEKQTTDNCEQWKSRAMAALEMVEVQMAEISALEEMANQFRMAADELIKALRVEQGAGGDEAERALARHESNSGIQRAHQHAVEARQACLQLAESAGMDVDKFNKN